MRLMGVVLVALLACAGCGNCSGSQTKSGMLANAAPMGSFMVTIEHCSTCAHTDAQVIWTGPDSGVSGTIDLKVYPSCFVQPFEVTRNATNGVGDFDDNFNVANCGDDIDYTGVVTNNTNTTFTSLELHFDCTPFHGAMPAM